MTKELNTEIIAVGTELLLGQITNTNAKWISEQLASKGINTYYHTVVGDNLDRLTDVFQQASERSDTVIITGGLGPTEDDLSREAFQKLSHIPIETEEHSLNRIKAFYDHKGLEMTANNKRQARVFKDSTVLENRTGMAPGNLVEHQGVRWIFMPGVPREMKQIFTDSVLPYLAKLNGGKLIHSTVLRFSGIGESALEHQLYHLIEKQNNPTIAPLATKDGVTIRLTAKATDLKTATAMIEETKKSVLEVVGDYYYGENDQTVEEIAGTLLKSKDKTVSVAESLTGGLFADKMVAQPGISNVFKGGIVCYAREIKEKLLQIPASLIHEEGTVSEACADMLAKNVSNIMDSDVGISFTGVAGPGKSENQEPGTVYIGLCDRNGYRQVEKCYFHGGRKEIRYRAVLKGFDMIIRYLKKL